MRYRLAEKRELSKLKKLYDDVIDHQKDDIYGAGWTKDVYPSRGDLDRHLKEDLVYVIDDDGVFAGAGYTLAAVVDDLLMGVTEVVRGDDLLAATPAPASSRFVKMKCIRKHPGPENLLMRKWLCCICLRFILITGGEDLQKTSCGTLLKRRKRHRKLSISMS